VTAPHRRAGVATPGAPAARSLAVVGTLALIAPAARADHDMATHVHPDQPELSLGLSVEAAQFDTMLYVGSYQGVTPSVGWMHGRFGGQAAIGLYHLNENGLSVYGAGDAALGAHALVVDGAATQVGAALHVMLPTGSELHGFGMGHVMAMPSLWASWQSHPFALAASAGYSRALSRADGAHMHGMMPLVDPMNMSELTWSAGGDIMVGRRVRVGGRALGGVPIGAGLTRVIGAARVAWGTPHVTTALELQLGLVGDPFTIRSVVDTALRF
jgi:hypothetical protein